MNLAATSNTIDDETRWINQARNGDTQAFECLYHRHHQQVYALCLRLAGQVPLAEEMTQDCFVRAWQKLDLFRGESQFATWLHRLSVNQALASLQKHRSFWARFLPESSTEFHEISEPSTPLPNGMQLDKYILRLPERARVVFVLFALEGYSHEEIAQLMQITRGTSKAQYHRAKALLQEMLS
ncbi:RNA polymerase sigma factor [Shewanella electrica]|uniref:RNA polymerase sigma factor n=1 Tax=Shewanella electrica TaxID=515560 RepID=UPI003F6975A4